ncbi:MAG: patatin-like phospholipase family protein [Bacteroidota bacterium]|nr:patatin-like phospholipase family protein [Bacteroidota bacterium]MDP3146228.1 patatin-like phospholipase family protein [Bacteroidota bacterium]MDP3558145.1 patatin-like phospholipase family protein [Bacteroidota bacterium]
MRKTLNIVALLLFLLTVGSVKAQKIGLVLSGGGASGLSHIGVLKALEENSVPVDYISGTSIGSLIGAYYAVGYSPKEIENLVKTIFFQSITKGDLPAKYEYMVKKRDDYASWLTFKLNIKDNYLKNLPTNVINSIPIDYYLMETFTGVSNSVNNNFDSLIVPFRCVASDVQNKKSVTFRDGDLSSSIRASMSYPFYLRPISIDGKLLFDGGLYNNFPTDVMYNDFNPDYIIGANVAEKNLPPDDDNLYLQLRNLLMTQTNFEPVCENGILIEPWSDVSVFNFDNAQRLIDSGYYATLRAIPQIKKQVQRKLDLKNLEEQRKKFKEYQKLENIVYDNLEVTGYTKNQEHFISKSIFYKNKPFTINQLKKRYFRLAGDDKIKNIFPVSVIDTVTKKYTLKLFGKKEKPFYVDAGAILSNRPISEAFLGLQYNHLGKIGTSIYANGYLGKLYSGTHSHIRFDFPGKNPFYIEPSFTYSRWDYYSSSVLFYDFLKPAFLIQEDKFGEIKVGVPVGNISQTNFAAGYTEWTNQYYQTENFTKLDTTDKTYFDYWYLQANYTINTLNRKMYASEGSFVNARARFLQGRESHQPGNTSIDTSSFKNIIQPTWLQLKLTIDKYFKTSKSFKVGVFGEGVYSTQGFFSNYQATILSTPAFNPTPESQTFFIEAYRAHKYLAGGLKLIVTPIKNIDIRTEAYIFQPIESILKTSDGGSRYSSPFLYRYISGLAALVYNSPIGPVSLGVNYYDQNDNSFSFFFHIGYIIFNRKSID